MAYLRDFNRKRNEVLQMFIDMGANQDQLAIEKFKTLSPRYTQSWYAVIYKPGEEIYGQENTGASRG